MKINSHRMRVIERAVAEVVDVKGISIYSQLEDVYDEDSKLVFGVNWSCFGTVSVEDTWEFADNLKRAAVIADGLNGLELHMVYEDDEVISARIANNSYKDLVESIATIIDAGAWDWIAEWIEKGNR